MRSVLISCVATVALLAGSTATAAPPVPQPLQYARTVTWTCEAESPVAFGVGIARTRVQARQRALFECAARTPYGLVCVITTCSKEDDDDEG